MNVANELRAFARLRPLQLLMLAGLLSFLAWYCCYLKWSVLDPDIWWHLRTGDWILQNRTLPHNGIFSYTAGDRSWAAYSWLYEVILSLFYRVLGPLGVATFGVLLTLAVAYSVFWMANRLSGRFWISCLVAAWTSYAFLFDVTPRSVFFSIIFFIVTLTFLFEANHSGEIRTLYWLPVIFFLWSNTHIQFIYGLFLVGLYATVGFACSKSGHFRPALPRHNPGQFYKTLFLIFAASAAATCLGPYSVRLYWVIFHYIGGSFPYAVIHEFQPIDFRSPTHFAQLFLAGTAFYFVGATGRTERIDPLKLLLLVVAVVVGFRTIRDAWFICIPSAACIADGITKESGVRRGETTLERIGLALVLLLAILLISRNTDFNQRGIAHAVREEFPVGAVQYVRQNPMQGPLYNTLDWGGFLAWALPDYQVAIDGRYDLYWEDLSWHFYRAQMGRDGYVADRYLEKAGFVIVQKDAPLAGFLATDARFTTVYRDKLALVFVRRH